MVLRESKRITTMNNNKKIDEFLDEKLRKAGGFTLPADFSKNLMVRINEESAQVREELKTNKLAKYILGGFSSFVIGLTILLGLLSGSKSQVTAPGRFNIEPTLETSNDYINRFFTFISDTFTKAVGLLGLSSSPHTVELIAALVIAFVLFMAADRIFIKGKLRTNKL